MKTITKRRDSEDLDVSHTKYLSLLQYYNFFYSLLTLSFQHKILFFFFVKKYLPKRIEKSYNFVKYSKIV